VKVQNEATRAIRKMTIWAVAVVLLLAVAAPAQASGVTYHVSPAGNDDAAGSAAAPWRTVGKAIEAVAAGDTVVLHAGTYGERGTFMRFARSGAPGAPITWRAAAGEARPVLLGAIQVTGDDQTFERLVFDGPTGPVLTPTTTNPLGEEVQVAVYGDRVEIAHSEVRDCLWHAGIYLKDAYDARLIGNYVHDNGNFARAEQANLDHGIYFSRGSGLIANNVIEHNLAFGVQLYPAPAHVTVAHNTIVGHGRSGVIVATAAADNLIVNNVIANNRQEAVRSYALTGLGNRVVRNLAWGNGEGNLGISIDGLQLVDNLQADPQFAGPGDYHLQPTSPAIDAALPGYGPDSDYDGNPRPTGNAPDIGAYEGG
jgi:hypothetical protein